MEDKKITKRELIDRVYKKYTENTFINKSEVSAIVELTCELLKKAIINGEGFELRGLMNGKKQWSAQRLGLNVSTREKITIPARFSYKVRVSKQLEEQMNEKIRG